MKVHLRLRGTPMLHRNAILSVSPHLLPLALALAAAGSTGCALEDEPSLEERAVESSRGDHDALGVDDDDDAAGRNEPTISGAGSVCGQERAPALLMVEPGTPEQVVTPGAAVHLELENHHESGGVATILVDVHHEHTAQVPPVVYEVDLEGGVGQTTVVELPVDALGLPTVALALSGQLAITTRVDYDDGSRTVVDGATRLYFHPEGGNWRIYDEATRDARYHRGALTEELRRWAADNPDSRFGPAHIQQVAEDTSWVPSRDEADDLALAAPEHDPMVDPSHPHEVSHLLTNAQNPIQDPAVGSSTLTSPSDPAQFPTVKFCFKQKSQFTDAGNGEDFWTSTSNYARTVAGTRITVYRDGSPIAVWLGDGYGAGDPGKGCTQPLVPGAGFTFRVYSWAKVQNNNIYVKAEDWSESNYFDIPVLKYIGSSGGTFDVTFDPGTAVHNVMAATSQGVYMHAGGLSGKTYDVEVFSDQSRADPNYVNNTASIFIEDGDENKKFIVTHELGHAVGGQATDGRLTGNDCGYSSVSCPSGGSHSMTSKEHSSCAIGEGYAHFYSADVWNSHSENDCYFEYWSGADTTVNCEGSSTAYPTAYMENECAPSYGGRGVELDWLRQFWDVHTEGTDPTMNQMLSWMDSAVEWGDNNGYSRLDSAANSYGGQINTNWDNRKSFNGIDY